VRQSRHLAGRCRGDQSHQISSFAALLAADGTQSISQGAWLETLRPALMRVSTRAAPSSVSVEPIYTLSNAPRTLEG
jgi:hypothetical protein